MFLTVSEDFASWSGSRLGFSAPNLAYSNAVVLSLYIYSSLPFWFKEVPICWWDCPLANHVFSHFIAHHCTHSNVDRRSCEYITYYRHHLTISDSIWPFLIEIVFSQLLSNFIVLDYLAAISLSPRLKTAKHLENLSIELFITELIGPLAH